MDQETAGDKPFRIIEYTFHNPCGLRAGWRLLIYAGFILLLVLLGGIAAKHLGGPAKGPQPSAMVQTAFQVAGEFVFFLVFLLLAWIMSKIEHRRVSEYGLPLRKSAFSDFVTGYLLWGFLPLSCLLLFLRLLHVFYFGSLSALNLQIFAWAALWWLFFLFVGLFEEYSFRGYVLHTLAEGIGFWPAALILAVGFARVHMGNSGETRIGIIATGIFALFAAATLWRTGNLWLAVGAHAGWDWGQSFIYGVSDSGFQSPGHLLNPHIQGGPDWLTGGTVGPEGSVFTLILWALMTIAIIYFYPKQPEPALNTAVQEDLSPKDV
jgi:membrane protease YdiL (CAAX protease family)